MFDYNNVAYPSLVHPQTFPANLAVNTFLLGMDPAPPHKCRVLELGCGDGLNLAVIAAAYPESEYVGIDLAEIAVERGNAMIAGMGIKNVRLVAGDIATIDASWGEFDYIIAHGVYSWVPEGVRDALLRVMGERLAPQGAAFVSYLALPGACLREMLRTVLRFHTRGISDGEEAAKQAQAFLHYIADSHEEPRLYQKFVKEELDHVDVRSAGSLVHDELSAISHPVLLTEFLMHAQKFGLAFACEAEYHRVQPIGLTKEATKKLEPLTSNRVAYEQYLDFLEGRRFRQTVLCRIERASQLGERPERLRHCRVTCPGHVAPPGWGDITSTDKITIQGSRKSSFTVELPLAKAVMRLLCEAFPRSLTVAEALRLGREVLLKAADGRPLPDAYLDEEKTIELLLQVHLPNMVEVRHGDAPEPMLTDTDTPKASPVARWQIANGWPRVSALDGRGVTMADRIGRHLLLLLDGTRTRSQLVTEMVAFLGPEGGSREAVEAELNRALEGLAHHVLLAR